MWRYHCLQLLIRENDFDGAILLCQREVDSHNMNCAAVMVLSQLLAATSNYKAAIRTYRKMWENMVSEMPDVSSEMFMKAFKINSHVYGEDQFLSRRPFSTTDSDR